MDTETQYTHTCCKPEVGRGCTFCDCGSEVEAKPCEGCCKLHETAWLEQYPANVPTDIVEVRFKNTRRAFYQNANELPLRIGDIVAVEASPGHDIGIISLTGDLVTRQMRRTGFNPYNGEYKKVYRKAKPYDIEKWQEAIAMEHETMIASRQIAADMGLNMKIGDVEYQGDKIKAIFYYIADERVDFRELIKVFAEQFHIRIEMKQIGARQEAGRIGGLGACGRELCCTSWISNFSSVTTGAARVQDISLNPQKLAGQCSKLKCCMMYEYDTYIDARKEFPRLREPLQTMDGEWYLVKNDTLAGTMTFSSSKESMANVTTLSIARVKEILSLNRQGKKVDQLQLADEVLPAEEEPTYRSEEDSITRFDQTKRRNKRGGRNRSRGDRPEGAAEGASEPRRPEEGAAQGQQTGERQQRQDRQDRQDRRPRRPDQPRGEGGNGRGEQRGDNRFSGNGGNNRGDRSRGEDGNGRGNNGSGNSNGARTAEDGNGGSAESTDRNNASRTENTNRGNNGGNGNNNGFGNNGSRTAEDGNGNREGGRNRHNRNRRRGNGNGGNNENNGGNSVPRNEGNGGSNSESGNTPRNNGGNGAPRNEGNGSSNGGEN